MTPSAWCVWEWVDSHNVPKFVGYGRIADSGAHPAEVLFANRFEVDSSLNDWLRTYDEEPKRSRNMPSLEMYKADAKAVCFQRRRQLESQNVALLRTRPYGTTAGGGSRRAVIDPRGLIFESVREASREVGKSASQITRLCQNPSSGWSYLDESDDPLLFLALS